MTLQQIKQRFHIVGNDPALHRALEIAIQIAPTEVAVLIQGESGTGKEVIPKIIHQLSPRRHKEYIAVNCGAIPEGTIDSELFGHEKGSFTGAVEARKGYFSVTDGGTIFLDEVAELPLKTQIRLLRVLETGEFLKVGSSKIEKTNVRVIAASHKNLLKEIEKGNFREDLYYRLNTVAIQLPALRERGEDIALLFRKFANDFAEKYHMPTLRLSEEAQKILLQYRFPGNIRQLRNLVEQITVLEQEREISKTVLQKYLPLETSTLPVLIHPQSFFDETEQPMNPQISLAEMYQMLKDLQKDTSDIKQFLLQIIQKAEQKNEDFSSPFPLSLPENLESQNKSLSLQKDLSLDNSERSLIEKALQKHRGKRKYAADELGISERTLYRKIKELGIDE